MKTIYLAGGCYWGVEKYISNIKGVLETTVGFANGDIEHPTYEQVRYENTGHAETVKVIYDETTLPLSALLNLFYEIIDPTSVDRQGEDVGHQYRTGIYFTDPVDEDVIRDSLNNLEKKLQTASLEGGENNTCVPAIEVCPLIHFYDAEEYHQKYLDKNPSGYCHVPLGKIRWVKDVEPKEFV